MRLLPAIAGLAFPACAEDGAAGIPIPAPRDIRGTTHSFSALPSRLIDVVEQSAEHIGLFSIAFYNDPIQLNFIARSPVLNIPTLIGVNIAEDGQMVLAAEPIYPMPNAYGQKAAADLLSSITRQLA